MHDRNCAFYYFYNDFWATEVDRQSCEFPDKVVCRAGVSLTYARPRTKAGYLSARSRIELLSELSESVRRSMSKTYVHICDHMCMLLIKLSA